MLQTILNIAGLAGLVFGAGFVGAYIAGSQAEKLESRIDPPWSAYDRSVLIGNMGFYCGAAGAGVIILVALAGWLGRLIQFTL